MRQEKEKMRAQLETSEKKILAITEDYEHLKAKMKQLKLKKSLDDNTKDEKLCLICKNLYKESENFNWSCKTHLSLYSGDVWWCCGKKGEVAPGCQASKHESKEEEKFDLEKEENLTINSHALCSVIYI